MSIALRESLINDGDGLESRTTIEVISPKSAGYSDFNDGTFVQFRLSRLDQPLIEISRSGQNKHAYLQPLLLRRCTQVLAEMLKLCDFR